MNHGRPITQATSPTYNDTAHLSPTKKCTDMCTRHSVRNCSNIARTGFTYISTLNMERIYKKHILMHIRAATAAHVSRKHCIFITYSHFHAHIQSTYPCFLELPHMHICTWHLRAIAAFPQHFPLLSVATFHINTLVFMKIPMYMSKNIHP